MLYVTTIFKFSSTQADFCKPVYLYLLQFSLNVKSLTGEMMRALLQRVLEAKVVVEGETTGEIQHGMLVFLGLGKEDTLEKGKKLIDKILKYRFFDDENGKMGWNINQANGGLLLVSQFTLMAQTQKGLRPDFAPAMPPSEAKVLYEQLVAYAESQFKQVQTGIFAADMKVHLVNDGPVTFNLEVE